jgi:LPS sulfotransferase NodH
MSKAVAVIAKQRSGTNLLRLTLASSRNFVDINEIFHENLDIGRFWKIRGDLIANNPDLAIPTNKNQSIIFDNFLKKIINSSDLLPIIDIKYNSAHHLNGIWHENHNIPFLLKLLAKHEIPVIHIVRSNILARYISSLVAQKTKKWVAGKGDKMEENVIVYVDISALINNLRNTREEINLYRSWLSKLKSLKSVEIAYESLIDAKGNFSETVLLEISQLLNIKEKLNIDIPIQKIVSRPLEDIIENYHSEVVPALRSSEFAYLLYWGK